MLAGSVAPFFSFSPKTEIFYKMIEAYTSDPMIYRSSGGMSRSAGQLTFSALALRLGGQLPSRTRQSSVGSTTHHVRGPSLGHLTTMRGSKTSMPHKTVQ